MLDRRVYLNDAGTALSQEVTWQDEDEDGWTWVGTLLHSLCFKGDAERISSLKHQLVPSILRDTSAVCTRPNGATWTGVSSIL